MHGQAIFSPKFPGNSCNLTQVSWQHGDTESGDTVSTVTSDSCYRAIVDFGRMHLIWRQSAPHSNCRKTQTPPAPVFFSHQGVVE